MSEAETFEIGDVATLKSGGPQMTVTNVGEPWYGGGVQHAWCSWFVDGEEHHETFPCPSLEKINTMGEGELERED